MKKCLSILLLVFFCIGAFATDTLRYSNGCIESVYDHYHYYERYYVNGQLEYKNVSETFFRKGKNINYDSLGNITSKGHTKFNGHKWGRWVEYDEKRKKHITRYKYGVEKSKLRTKEGKRIRCILVHGLGAWSAGLCDSAVTKYRINFIAVGGCVMPRAAYPKTDLHNFFTECYMIIRHRWDWEDKADRLCGNPQ